MLASEGVLKTFDVKLHQTLMAVKQNEHTPSGTESLTLLQNPVAFSSLAILLVGLIMVSLWSFLGWGAYRQVNSLSK
jgi:hypothetical protein